MTQLDRIEQKLDHLLRLIESSPLRHDDASLEGGTAEGSKTFKLPPRELRKWPEINHRGPRLPKGSR